MLRSLKRDQRRALAMLALGFSYREICAANGWTYTKVNVLAIGERRRMVAHRRAARRLGERRRGGEERR